MSILDGLAGRGGPSFFRRQGWFYSTVQQGILDVELHAGVLLLCGFIRVDMLRMYF